MKVDSNPTWLVSLWEGIRHRHQGKTTRGLGEGCRLQANMRGLRRQPSWPLISDFQPPDLVKVVVCHLGDPSPVVCHHGGLSRKSSNFPKPAHLEGEYIEAPIIWPSDRNNQLIGKDPDAGKDGRQEEKRDDRGWDGWMASLTQWTWIWANSGRWWRTGKPGVLQSMGSQGVRHELVNEQ